MIKLQQFLKKLSESIFAVIKVVLLSGIRKTIKYIPREKELIILGNGPSLNSMISENREFYKERDIMCVNFFPLTSFYEELKPGIFIVAAPELWLKGVDQVYLEKSGQLFDALNQKTRWPLQLLIPFSARKSGRWKSQISFNENIKTVYYNDTGIEGFSFLNFWLFKRGLAMPRPHNVLLPSLMNGINMGYKNIYLWGAENNQFLEMTVDNQNNALISQKHFYDSSEVTAKAMRKLGKDKRRVHEILHKFMLSFKGYHIIRQYADSRGSHVLNQTPGSMIDAFEREDA